MPLKFIGLATKRKGGYNLNDCHFYVLAVQLLDGSTLQCTLKLDSTGDDCMNYIMQKLDLQQNMYFGLKYKCAPTVYRWVDLQKPLKKQLMKYACEFKLYFSVMFYISHPESISNNSERYYYYLQMRSDILNGRLFGTPEKAILCASYSLQAEFGDYDPRKQNENVLKNFALLPLHMTKSAQILEGIVKQALMGHEQLKRMSQAEAELAYIKEARNFEGYGEEYFPGLDEEGAEIFIGYCLSGLIVKRIQSLSVIYGWSEIKKVTSNKRRLYLDCCELSRRVVFQLEDSSTAEYAAFLFGLQLQFYKKLENFAFNSAATNSSSSINASASNSRSSSTTNINICNVQQPEYASKNAPSHENTFSHHVNACETAPLNMVNHNYRPAKSTASKLNGSSSNTIMNSEQLFNPGHQQHSNNFNSKNDKISTNSPNAANGFPPPSGSSSSTKANSRLLTPTLSCDANNVVRPYSSLAYCSNNENNNNRFESHLLNQSAALILPPYQPAPDYDALFKKNVPSNRQYHHLQKPAAQVTTAYSASTPHLNLLVHHHQQQQQQQQHQTQVLHHPLHCLNPNPLSNIISTSGLCSYSPSGQNSCPKFYNSLMALNSDTSNNSHLLHHNCKNNTNDNAAPPNYSESKNSYSTSNLHINGFTTGCKSDIAVVANLSSSPYQDHSMQAGSSENTTSKSTSNDLLSLQEKLKDEFQSMSVISNNLSFPSLTTAKIDVGNEALEYLIMKTPREAAKFEEMLNTIWNRNCRIIVALNNQTDYMSQTLWYKLENFNLSLLTSTRNSRNRFVTSVLNLSDTFMPNVKRTIYHVQYLMCHQKQILNDVESFLEFLDELNSIQLLVKRESSCFAAADSLSSNCHNAAAIANGQNSPHYFNKNKRNSETRASINSTPNSNRRSSAQIVQRQQLIVNPLMVHCATGVDWTGIFLLTTWMMKISEHNQNVDMQNVLSMIRQQTGLNNMVPCSDQYAFCYSCLSNYSKKARLI